MTTLTFTKDQIREKVGKKWWLDDQQTLVAKLDYVSGIDVFDKILDGKTLKEFDAVIHLEKYPKGLLFTITKGLGFKTYLFPVAKNEIEKVVLSETPDSSGQLTFNLTDGNKIEFRIKKNDLWEVKDFLKEIKLNHETENIKKPENTQKHGVPDTMGKYSTLKNLAGIINFIAWLNLISGVILTIFSIQEELGTIFIISSLTGGLIGFILLLSFSKLILLALDIREK